MRPSRFISFKPAILALRAQGLSYSEINQKLGVRIPQSTLSNWCSSLALTSAQVTRLRQKMTGAEISRAVASLRAFQLRERRRTRSIMDQAYLLSFLGQYESAKIALFMLYLGEGSKTEQGAVSFSNSHPGIVKLFLYLFQACYVTNLSKFRITIQCRADQDLAKLEQFWSRIIDMPGVRFYKTRTDVRTQGIPTRKTGYRGVCRVEYIDARIQLELVNAGFWIANQFIK